MKTRRFLSLALSLALACSLSLPAAAAEETADQALSRVTAQVKQTLSIGGAYDEFYGSSYQNALSTVWSLNWSAKDGSSLYVEAEDDGTVISCYRSDPDYAGGGYDPAFPSLDRAQAHALVQSFLDKVLRAGLESARFDEGGSFNSQRSFYRFTGTILLNGIPSPLRFSASVRATDGAVTDFNRDSIGQTYLGGVPAAGAAVSRDEALSLLKSTLSLRLEYVRPEGEDTAVLRYLPEAGDSYYVDGESGELVNLSELYRALEEDGSFYNTAAGGAAPTPAPTEAAADGGAALTAAEQAGIEKLEGVLSREALDAKVRAHAALGLEGYALTNTSYAVVRETGEVTASLRYVRQAEEGSWRRTATVDAKSGALLALSGSMPYDENRAAALTAGQAQSKAEAFLKALWGAQFAKTGLYAQEENVSRGRYTFTFAQKANGYFFPENSITVGVDVLDGSICALSRRFDDGVKFGAASGLVGEDAALDAWLASFPAELAYVSVPQALDPDSGEAKPLLDMGLRYFYALKPGYALGDNGCTGVDAKTGACLARPSYGGEAFTYDDMEGHWARRQVEALADYGAGFPGGSFRPGEALTQADLLTLLLSAQGYTGQDADALYQRAYNLGFLTPDQRQDGKQLTRAEAVALLLDALGYGKAARLEGIYTCGFADAASIPAQYRGYAAIAQALGVAHGDNVGNFNANRTATRLEGALMLYNYMSR